jgi:hypothetical protein
MILKVFKSYYPVISKERRSFSKGNILKKCCYWIMPGSQVVRKPKGFMITKSLYGTAEFMRFTTKFPKLLSLS